jgi:hypothetical protein
METCIDCNEHRVIKDPDPNDWFCDDDVAVVCTLMGNTKRDLDSKYLAERNEFRCITVGCRPYNIKKETVVPEWCPKGK